MGWLGKVCGTLPIARELRQAIGVIAMLVGNEDAVNVLGARAAQRFESPQHFFFAKSGVNEESRAPRFEQCGIARAARG